MKEMRTRIKVISSIIMFLAGSALASVVLIEDILIWAIVTLSVGIGTHFLLNKIKVRYIDGFKYAKIFGRIMLCTFLFVLAYIQFFIM